MCMSVYIYIYIYTNSARNATSDVSCWQLQVNKLRFVLSMNQELFQQVLPEHTRSSLLTAVLGWFSFVASTCIPEVSLLEAQRPSVGNPSCRCRL